MEQLLLGLGVTGRGEGELEAQNFYRLGFLCRRECVYSYMTARCRCGGGLAVSGGLFGREFGLVMGALLGASSRAV